MVEATRTCKELEEAVTANPTSTQAVEALRRHAEAHLQPAITDAIDGQLAMDGILATCDHAIEAGEGFDKFYTSTFENTIRPGEGGDLGGDQG